MSTPSTAPLSILERLRQSGKPPLMQSADRTAELIALRNAGFEAGDTPQKRVAGELVTQDPHMIEQIRLAELYANTIEQQSANHIMSVYIHGPTGTGKELLAKIIAASGAKIMPNGTINYNFHPVNCAGLPTELFESILFGHARGSFTGAIRDHEGILVSASTGTVFLDEIADLRLDQQAKLLRALQDRRVRPVGSDRELKISCRFVFATNKSLYKQMAAGLFREDLFYRIAQCTLRTTALRERELDVPLIARTIIRQRGYRAWTDDESVIPPICYERGNVRQLLNSIVARQHVGSFPAVAEKLQQEIDII